MPVASVEPRREIAPDRRPVTTTGSLVRGFVLAAPPSAGLALQLRFGNLGTQALLRARLEPEPEPLAPSPVASVPGAAEAPTAEVRPEPAAAPAEAAAPAAAPSPHQAMAPAISAIQHRAAAACKHSKPAEVPVVSAEKAGTKPSVENRRAADHHTIQNLDAVTQETKKKDKSFKEAFVEQLQNAISNMRTPTTESEADALRKTGAKNANETLRSASVAQSAAVIGPLWSAANPQEQSLGASDAPSMQLEQVGPPPASVSAASVVPAPLPAERFDFSSDRAPTDQVMAENDVTKQQLEEGNDPAFSPALEARAAADKHEAGIEARYRQAESKIQGNALGAAQHALAQGLDGMHGARKTRIEEVIKQQHGTKSKNANERKAITDKITDIKNDTLNRVKLTLSFLETMAPIIFDNGLRRAETAYNDAFKEAKGGLAERAWDWATKWRSSWDEHIQNLLNAAKKAYDKEVRRAIDEVADFVEAQLTYARRWVEVGLEKIEEFVRDLEPGLKTFGANAARAVRADFEAMVTDIDHRAEGLIDKLSEQYKASHQRMSEMEEKLRQENKSLWDRVYDATVGLIKKIIAFKDMLLDILGRAVSVIVDIIAHPIRFLETLVSAVGDGLNNFIAKIDVYLQQGIIAWLFGQGGLRLPDKFDLPGVSSIVLQILHIDSAYFRARAVTLVGERVVATLEHGAEVFKIVKAEGIPGLQRLAQQHLTDLKSMVLDAIWGSLRTA